MNSDDSIEVSSDPENEVDYLRNEVQYLREENRQLREENHQLREVDAKPEAPPNEDIVEEFFLNKSYADSTERPYRLSIKYFREFTDDSPLCEATVADVLGFANNWGAERDLAASTIQVYLRRVKKLYDWMEEQPWGPDENVVKEGLGQFKQANRARLRRSGQHTGTVLRPHEFVSLIKWNRTPREYALLMVAVKTGLRRKELTYLKVDDLDLEGKKLYNCSPKGVGEGRIPKNNADQKFIDEETVDAIQLWLDKRDGIMNRMDGHDDGWVFINRDGDQATTMSVSRWWSNATARASKGLDGSDPQLSKKLSGFTPHDARRCFTTWLNQNGCPRDIIAALRGDADSDMVALYTHYGEDEIRDAYEKAMPSIGI